MNVTKTKPGRSTRPRSGRPTKEQAGQITGHIVDVATRLFMEFELRVDQHRSDRGDCPDFEADVLHALRFERGAIRGGDPEVGR